MCRVVLEMLMTRPEGEFDHIGIKEGTIDLRNIDAYLAEVCSSNELEVRRSMAGKRRVTMGKRKWPQDSKIVYEN